MFIISVFWFCKNETELVLSCEVTDVTASVLGDLGADKVLETSGAGDDGLFIIDSFDDLVDGV